MSIFTEQADLEAVLEMVRELDYVDQENVLEEGQAEGSATESTADTTASQYKKTDEQNGKHIKFPFFHP